MFQKRLLYHTSRTCCSTVRPSTPDRPPRYARYRISIFVVSVLPAPLSPLTRMELLFPSLIIALFVEIVNILCKGRGRKDGRIYDITCTQHLQLQKHEGSILQMQLLYTVPSYEYHTDEVIFEMG